MTSPPVFMKSPRAPETRAASNYRQGPSDYGTHAFGGACPPQGDKPHHYIFTIYALKTGKIDVPANASAALIGYMIHGNMLGKATFTVTYGR